MGYQHGLSARQLIASQHRKKVKCWAELLSRKKEWTVVHAALVQAHSIFFLLPNLVPCRRQATQNHSTVETAYRVRTRLAILLSPSLNTIHDHKSK